MNSHFDRSLVLGKLSVILGTPHCSKFFSWVFAAGCFTRGRHVGLRGTLGTAQGRSGASCGQVAGCETMYLE